jgi:putative flippase GtrA
VIRQSWGLLLYLLGLVDKKQLKERFFVFLQGVEQINERVQAFWQEHKKKICSWYLAQRKPDDVIISASPEFLLQPICDSLGIVHLISSRVSRYSGAFFGENCYGAQKLERVRIYFGDIQFEAFYSDSLSDQPMTALAKSSFIVENDNLIPWAEYRMSGWKKAKRLFFSPEFFRFLVIGCINAFNGVLFAYLLSLLFPAQVSFICGYLLSLVISYVINSLFTFHEIISISKMLKFMVSYIPNFLIQNAVVFVLLTLLRLPELLSFTVAAVIGVPVTFILLKLFTFNK